jgi:hypothetical protein
MPPWSLFLFVALFEWKLKNRPTKHPLGQAGKSLRKKSEELIGCF